LHHSPPLVKISLPSCVVSFLGAQAISPRRWPIRFPTFKFQHPDKSECRIHLRRRLCYDASINYPRSGQSKPPLFLPSRYDRCRPNSLIFLPRTSIAKGFPIGFLRGRFVGVHLCGLILSFTYEKVPVPNWFPQETLFPSSSTSFCLTLSSPG